MSAETSAETFFFFFLMENDDGGTRGDVLNPSPLHELCASEFSSDVAQNPKTDKKSQGWALGKLSPKGRLLINVKKRSAC